MWQARKNVNDTRNGNTRNDNNRHTCITRVALCNIIYTWTKCTFKDKMKLL